MIKQRNVPISHIAFLIFLSTAVMVAGGVGLAFITTNALNFGILLGEK